MGNRYEEYITRYCQTGNSTPEAARELSICREVEKYYNDENKASVPLHHEFICCSES